MAPEHASVRDYARGLPAFLKNNPNFTRYLAGQTFVILGAMAIPFVIIYARERYGVDDEFAGTMTVAALIAQSAGTPVLGWLSDRIGHKFMILLSACLGIAGLVLVSVASGAAWLGPVFVLTNLAQAGGKIARFGITMEFGRLERLPTFTALAGTILAAPTFLAPIIGGWLVDSVGFVPMFSIAGCFLAAGAFVVYRGVVDPRKGAAAGTPQT
jgi:MFS family permease